jgi:hypothetical protein
MPNNYGKPTTTLNAVGSRGRIVDSAVDAATGNVDPTPAQSQSAATPSRNAGMSQSDFGNGRRLTPEQAAAKQAKLAEMLRRRNPEGF